MNNEPEAPQWMKEMFSELSVTFERSRPTTRIFSLLSRISHLTLTENKACS
jgi:hypothetical protein